MTDELVSSPSARRLTAERFQRLTTVPPELEWFANIDNKSTRRAYENALQGFMRFTGIRAPAEFRIVTRSHVIAWRDDLVVRALSGMTIRHRLAALSSLFEHLCESNAVTHNPVKGVKRPPVESYEGKTPALGDHQARALLEAPDAVSLKGKRDRSILATLLYHALRREELCKLTVKDFRHERRGMAHLKVSGKGSKTRYVPLHPAAGGLIVDYFEANGRGLETTGALSRAIRSRGEGVTKAITADGVYKIVRGYSAKLGFEIGAHALRATAATNALDHQADIAKVQEWLGHANIATTRIYDERRRGRRVEVRTKGPGPFALSWGSRPSYGACRFRPPRPRTWRRPF
jgi:integrase/recombinase XerD